MKRFIIMAFLISSCFACAVPNNSSFVVGQSGGNMNAVDNKRNSVAVQKNEEFRAFVPKAFWEKLYFESINERARSSKLSNLRSKGLLKDDFEIRLWNGFGLTLLQGFILKRTAGEWLAVDLDWEVSENKPGKRIPKQIDRKLEAPKSGWTTAWQKLIDAEILTLPDAKEINCEGGATDGISFVVEYNSQNTYRTYMYDNPNVAKCEEAKRMIEIVKIIREEFYNR